MSTDATRQSFDAWYVSGAFDLTASPLGSRDCALQWAAWQAGADSQQKELRRLRGLSLEWTNAALEMESKLQNTLNRVIQTQALPTAHAIARIALNGIP